MSLDLNLNQDKANPKPGFFNYNALNAYLFF